MTHIRLKFVQSWVDAEGRVYRYFRRRGCPLVPLPGMPGSEIFNRAYEQALGAAPPPTGEAKRSLPGSVSAAITGSTPAARRAALERFREKHGTLPIAGMQRRHILTLLDGMPPFAARNWLKAIRGLVRYCLDHEIIRQDPTHGIRLAHTKSDGIHTWNEEEIAQFEAHFPIGTKARLALALGLYTAQRRGDVVKLGPQHIRDGVLTLRQQKTRASLSIPLHPELQAILNAKPGSHLTFLVTKTNKSYAPQDFSKQFRAWCDEAGLPPECSFHGLRKAALTRLADAGCSVHQIAAVSGHKTLTEVQRYTAAVNQASLAREAMVRMGERIGTESVKRPKPASVKATENVEEKGVGMSLPGRWRW
jgi:integrase